MPHPSGQVCSLVHLLVTMRSDYAGGQAHRHGHDDGGGQLAANAEVGGIYEMHSRHLQVHTLAR